jgi:hypothetical protein
VATREFKFKFLFCERVNCPPSEYETRAFKECLYWHARLLAPVLQRVKADWFGKDFKFIRYLGEATDVREANAEAAGFHDANFASRDFCRSRLKIRVSGRKATTLANELFSGTREPVRKAS